MIKLFLFLFGFFVCSNVFAKEITVKPKKFRHCRDVYYDIGALCNRDVCEKNEDHRESYLCGDNYGINGCAWFNLLVNFTEYDKILRKDFENYKDNAQYFKNSAKDANDNGYQINSDDTVFGTQGIGDYKVVSCTGVFYFISDSQVEKLSAKKAFFNKTEQQKFCKHLKECSTIVEEILRKEGQL